MSVSSSLAAKRQVPSGVSFMPLSSLAVALLLAFPYQTQAQEVEELDRIVVKAEQELKQTLGSSIITAEDIQKSPPANDISEVLRTMPGVNLTGNSASGQRGNNRQIDIRGMGPENTMILIDGKPVSSRSAVRFGWRGERDSRGDTNWVPAEQIERVEVLRGPAAARYGNGAAGGVVNIITKPTTDKFQGTYSLYGNLPEHSDEGATRRMSFGLSGPISESLSFRLYGNLNKTDSDDPEINKGHQTERGGANANSLPAGREGVRNKDINGLLSWRPDSHQTVDLEASYSRQGNIYTGDTQNTNTNDEVKRQLGDETNKMYRQSYSLTHRGDWNDKTNTLSYFQYEKTRNYRILEGLAGGTEGAFNDPLRVKDGGFGTIDLTTMTAHTELSHQFKTGSIEQYATFGLEWVGQELNDKSSELAARNPDRIPGSPRAYKPKARANIYSVFVEDNIYATDKTTVTPGLRFDYHDIHGSNWSPSLNLSHAVTDNWLFKAGIARAYKAPNLYQSNDGYTLYSAGNGCWGNTGGNNEPGCFLQGNSNLKAETSLNKELGVEYVGDDGLGASLTYFHNDYRNKVEAGRFALSSFPAMNKDQLILQWENIPKAVVSGLEGNLTLPLAENWLWSTNFTYMIESKNKTTGEALSTIPKYTINTTLDWNVNADWSLRAKATFYGEQKPPKYDFYGQPLTGSATDKVSPYALFGLSTQYKINKHFRINAGVDNLFDKRLFRRGNAIGVNLTNANYIYGAGARTFNQPGRTFFLGLSGTF